MPNHFHFMVKVNRVEVLVHPSWEREQHERRAGESISGDGRDASEGFAQSETLSGVKKRSLNDSIGILLRSYTCAINKQQKRSGSLFRNQTKAQCLTHSEGITPSFISTKTGTRMHTLCSEQQYPHICFNYIHQNPVNAGLVRSETNWEFSSAQDYAGLRKGTLVNKEVAKEYIVLQ